MEIKNRELAERLDSFIRGLKKEDRIAILHHTDPDGVSSAAILNRIVEKARGKRIDLRLSQGPDELSIKKETFSRLKKKKISKLIIADLSLDQYPDYVQDTEKFAEMLILDHHKLYRNLNSKKTVHIKPQMISSEVEASKYCTAKLAFDLGSRLFDLTESDWIAAIGIIGDNAADAWKDFLSKTFARNKIPAKKDAFSTIIGKATETLFFTEAYDFRKAGECYDILCSAKSSREVVNSRLSKYRKAIQQEISYWKRNVRKLAEFYPKQELIFDYIKPRYAIKSAISSAISSLYPNRTIIIAQDMKRDFIQLSVRRRDSKVAVNDLLERSLKTLDSANGGGHRNSAGGRIRKEDLYKFKESVLRQLEILK
ncbi:hypothetical protein J4212_00310 [Candidatus Woesearchaeota archaeon]|nr:hypothetical protein [Candidatus Woesearchaeota archaeon]